ncbi:protein of unknown function [Pseudodesulfovibrio piezophilus C1TLV30]|uniref:Uncharacterized protein n=1 Tax=Pseudodesulfovibrio piezophilus (strain DSM 21447 / JCM 15486 / C1TLV30) TaxID=1322246 RepID=M1WRL2_PSEP2|nr:protein of unknown function [Pseudodesulfovibrio piezophilus C1TLV30]
MLAVFDVAEVHARCENLDLVYAFHLVDEVDGVASPIAGVAPSDAVVAVLPERVLAAERADEVAALGGRVEAEVGEECLEVDAF